jgi:hypothetical protein
MITIPDVVETMLVNTPYLEDCLKKGLINYSALARQMKPQIEKETLKEVTEGSIMMALKRLEKKLIMKTVPLEIFKHIPEMIVRSHLFEVTLSNHLFNRATERSLLNELEGSGDHFFTLTHGVFESTIIASLDLKQKILTLLKSHHIVSQFYDLSSITIKLPTENIVSPGVYYSILKALALSGINVMEVVSTANEFTIIIDGKYTDKAFTALKEFFEYSSSFTKKR